MPQQALHIHLSAQPAEKSRAVGSNEIINGSDVGNWKRDFDVYSVDNDCLPVRNDAWSETRRWTTFVTFLIRANRPFLVRLTDAMVSRATTVSDASLR